MQTKKQVQTLICVLVAVIGPPMLRWGAEFYDEPTNGQINSAIFVLFLGAFYTYSARRNPIPQNMILWNHQVVYITVLYGLGYSCMWLSRYEFVIYQMIAGYIVMIVGVWILMRTNQDEGKKFYYIPFMEKTDESELVKFGVTRLQSTDQTPLSGESIIADLRSEMPREYMQFLSQCALNGVSVYHVRQAKEMLSGRVEIDHLYENQMGSLLPSPTFIFCKSIYERVFAATVLFILAIPLLAIYVAIKMETPGPGIFKQVRIGYKGKPFIMYKFRTMKHHANWSGHTQLQDTRVTRLGGILRRHRIDEIPQLFNVIRGDMSLIGPRPEAVPLAKKFKREIPFFMYRYVVRPGITGWAQVSQGFAVEPDEMRTKLHFDLFYIKHISFFLDLQIVLRTVTVVLFGRGAR